MPLISNRSAELFDEVVTESCCRAPKLEMLDQRAPAKRLIRGCGIFPHGRAHLRACRDVRVEIRAQAKTLSATFGSTRCSTEVPFHSFRRRILEYLWSVVAAACSGCPQAHSDPDSPTNIPWVFSAKTHCPDLVGGASILRCFAARVSRSMNE